MTSRPAVRVTTLIILSTGRMTTLSSASSTLNSLSAVFSRIRETFLLATREVYASDRNRFICKQLVDGIAKCFLEFDVGRLLRPALGITSLGEIRECLLRNHRSVADDSASTPPQLKYMELIAAYEREI